MGKVSNTDTVFLVICFATVAWISTKAAIAFIRGTQKPK